MADYFTELQIIKTVKKLERDLQATDTRGIFPWQVSAWLDFYRCEQSLRKDMASMAQRGKLIRIGNSDSRLGYRLPQKQEKPANIITLDNWRATLQQRLKSA